MSSLALLGISPSIVMKLIQADIIEDSEILKLKPTELSSASDLSLKESSEVIRLVTSRKKCSKFHGTNLREMLEREEEVSHIVTFCESLDNLLGGGIPIGTITEISGTPGIGKTQLCLQACISVQLHKEHGGVEGEAIFIDTEGSFSVSRLREMAIWAEKHVATLGGNSEKITSFNVDNLLRKIFYFRCITYLELIAVIKHLHTFLKDHSKVRLIIIDSIAFHFRHDFTNMMARTGLLCSLTQDLIQQATKHKLAVIVTNQMTTKVEQSGEGQLVAALGETWGHCPTIRLYLFWSELIRCAKLIKAPHIPISTTQFQITSGGIRDKRLNNQNQFPLLESKKRKFED